MRFYPDTLHMPQGASNPYREFYPHMKYNNPMRNYSKGKLNEMNVSYNDIRKFPPSNSLNLANNGWSTDRISLSSEEYHYYLNLFNLNDKFDSHFIDNKTASSFLQNSGLSIAILHSVWEYSDVENKGYLTLEDFFVCCRLVAHAQSGNSPNSDLINIRMKRKEKEREKERERRRKRGEKEKERERRRKRGEKEKEKKRRKREGEKEKEKKRRKREGEKEEKKRRRKREREGEKEREKKRRNCLENTEETK
ncbi:formin 2, putative [Plasmodium ovale wallikeri]|uniref:Formin 2, putative n=1 Tax=Plasmodium ovale wallikeri TaxID=864142 RepID=A0A1A8YMQ8_PLAOA|nr:formin 2, putative [Plasmodium ovale wallikeri]